MTSQNQKIEKPSWVKIKPAELEEIVAELAKQGIPPAKIGLILRDKHGIPKSKLLGKRITEILKNSKITFTTEKDTVDKKIDKLRNHITKNKHDYPASRSLTKQLWNLHYLTKK
jgi:small subunit ribosomal protein S15